MTDERNASLAHMLFDLGFDVWLGNTRGHLHGDHDAHTRLTTDDPLYWDFSFQEMIDFDLPAMVNYVVAHTGYRSLGLVRPISQPE